MSLLQNSNAISEGGYNIANSLRFQSASSTYLNRTPATTTNTTTWTWSAWIKRGTSADGKLFGAATGTSNTWYFQFSDNVTDGLTFGYFNGTNAVRVTTTSVYRDYSAWYHIVLAIDTTQATASNRVKIYVNGSQVTALTSTTYPTLNQTTWINNSTAPQYIGATSTNTSNLFDGYMTEVNFVDGQALTPSDFGETNTLTGQWIAKKYTGTYGTNGFYLPFSNGTSTTTLGYDSSGNSNNWTLNNFTRSAGTTECWMNDVPSGNGSVVGGTQPNSNYCVLNPLNTILPLSGANLIGTQSTAAWTSSSGTIAASSGKYYYEASMSTIGGGNYIALGLMLTGTAFNQYAGSNTNSWSVLSNSTNAASYYNAVSTNPLTISAGSTTVFQVAVDIDAGKLWLGYEDNWFGGGNPATGTTPTYTFTANSLVNPIISGYANTVHLNCGQRSFRKTPPSGFKALCTANLPAATIKKGNTVFDATTYTGNGTTNRAVVNSGAMQPDFVWVKDRSNVANHILVDAVRGITSVLYSNSTLAQQTGTAIASLNSNGFSVNEPNTGADSSNINARAYVGWQWNAGGSTVTNTSGSISSQVRANPTAGVSVVTYTGTGANATVGHGLGVAPKMVIVKSRSLGTEHWAVYHASLGATNVILLNLTNAASTLATVWNNTAPTSTVFSIGTNTSVNTNAATYVAYCFAEIAGFSKFGSYTGNGSADGVFVYLGFRPKFVLIKSSSAVSNWQLMDSSRSTYNVADGTLYPNSSANEYTGTLDYIDFLSNGFKIRNSNGDDNTSAGTYIYMAFAESPFQNSNSR